MKLEWVQTGSYSWCLRDLEGNDTTGTVAGGVWQYWNNSWYVYVKPSYDDIGPFASLQEAKNYCEVTATLCAS